MKKIDSQYKCLPFWSWNGELKEEDLLKQIDWMHQNGVGGFFMHARGGLTTEYLGEQWFKCIEACSKRAEELGMNAYAYDENGWPSGFAGGKLLEDIENHDRCWKVKYGKYDEKSVVAYNYSGDKLIRVKEGDDVMNIYMEYSSSTADILNEEVVEQFMKLTHHEYKKRDTYNLKGFFTDEPQYYRWGNPYSKKVGEYFKEKFNEDILDSIGLLFIEKEGYRKFRYRYWKIMQELMLKNFSKKIFDWCESNNYIFTGHYIEESSLRGQMNCCGGIMPFYEYEHIPGIDFLGRETSNEISSKQVGSVAQQLNKKQVICEMFACAGWDITPLELKHIAEFLYVNGVNLMCQHLLPYKEYGQRKRDYPSHFSAINPWVENNFKQFNDYFSILGEILANSKEIVKVCVLQPIRSCYFNYRKDKSGWGISEIDDFFAKIVESLNNLGILHHYIDETILASHGKVEGNKLIVGNCSYSFIVLPLIYTMDKSTESLIKEYITNGGKIYLANKKPNYLEYEEYEYDYLKTNTSLKEMIDSQDFYQYENKQIRLTYRANKEEKFIYIVNTKDSEVNFQIKFNEYKFFKQYNILTGSYKIINNFLHFDRYESKLLYLTNENEEKVDNSLSEINLRKGFEIIEKNKENLLTLDFLKFSVDNKSYSEKLHYMGVFNELLNKRYSGDVYLKYDFEIKIIPKVCGVCIEDEKIKEVYINNHLVDEFKLIWNNELREYDISKYLIEGNNEIKIVKNYYQDENVYYVLFNEKATESLKNCLAYTSNIEAIYLKGDFGVFGEFTKGKKEFVFLGKNFYLGEQPTRIENSLIKEGFPFFSGKIKLRQFQEVKNNKKYLAINNRFHLIDISINDSPKERLMFDYKLDISKMLKEGTNKFDIDLYISRRNHLGPFHTEDEENYYVSPNTFERKNTWKNGKSRILRESYSFVKCFLDYLK